MYHIRRADNHDERSIHKEDRDGLQTAIFEAVMRTAVTKADHQIVDDNGQIVHQINAVNYDDKEQRDQIDGHAAKAIKKWRLSKFEYILLAVWAAMVLNTLFNR